MNFGDPATITRDSIASAIAAAGDALDAADVPKNDRWVQVPTRMVKLLRMAFHKNGKFNKKGHRYYLRSEKRLSRRREARRLFELEQNQNFANGMMRSIT